ncbi:unnamed protein product [Vicia faba]|uniref:Transmembrane 9 superfamily member n=1 Tax=Vicia faba TaxID=3906 RepID=A0AAV0YCH6_VICFA|nr:unnamed protein product [Vicia faba]
MDLPYCQPSGGIKKSAENLGELLMGDQIDNSPYRFRMNVNETIYLCTTSPLNEHEVKLLKQQTRNLYKVNMIFDNLPVMRYTSQNGVKIQWIGFPVGYTPTDRSVDYIINHLNKTASHLKQRNQGTQWKHKNIKSEQKLKRWEFPN